MPGKKLIVLRKKALALYGWGRNDFGQLGVGDKDRRTEPVLIGNALSWVSIGRPDQAGAAIRSDGTLWTWGDNNSGELGHANKIESLIPKQVGYDNDWKKVSVALAHMAGIKKDGALLTWGYPGSNRLGRPTSGGNNTYPAIVGEDRDWVDVHAVSNRTFALKSNGSIWVVGSSNDGALGLGPDVTTVSEFTQVGVDTDWVGLFPGVYNTWAIKADGSLWCCGLNSSGQLGLGDEVNRYVFTRVGVDTDWKSVAASAGSFTVALKQDGSLWGVGSDAYGHLSQGESVVIDQFARMGTDNDWVSAATNFGTTYAIKEDGSLWACGRNWENQIDPSDTRNYWNLTKIDDGNWIQVESYGTSVLGLKKPSGSESLDAILGSSVLEFDNSDVATNSASADEMVYVNFYADGSIVVDAYLPVNHATTFLNPISTSPVDRYAIRVKVTNVVVDRADGLCTVAIVADHDSFSTGELLPGTHDVVSHWIDILPGTNSLGNPKSVILRTTASHPNLQDVVATATAIVEIRDKFTGKIISKRYDMTVDREYD